jgi:extradiol dioxygenase family protein
VTPFHLAIPVRDLAPARASYGGLPGCAEGRGSGERVDFDFFGHQLVRHAVEGRDAARLRAAGTVFDIEPHLRFKGQPGEQATMFLTDPSGNALEFKAFRDIAGQLLAS